MKRTSFVSLTQEESVVLGNRKLVFHCEGRRNFKIFGKFLEVIKKLEKELTTLMDQYEMPTKVVIHINGVGFGAGAGNRLLGTNLPLPAGSQVSLINLHIKGQETEWGALFDKEPATIISLLQTFIHEVIHNKHEDEEVTKEKEREYTVKIFQRVLDCFETLA